MSGADNQLIFQNCSIGRGNISFFEQFSVEISSGVVVLLGGNGTGKSTLFYTLLREIPLLQGEILLNSKSITTYTRLELAKMFSFLLTTRVFDDFLTVKECLELGRFPFRSSMKQLGSEDQSIISQYIELFKLAPFLSRRFGQLSDGEKQRILIARAFIQDTPFLFLDEPGNFLDVKHRLELFLQIRRIAQEKNKVIIFSTHDIEAVAKIFSTFWLVDRLKCKVIVGDRNIFTTEEFKRNFTSDKISFSSELYTFQFS